MSSSSLATLVCAIGVLGLFYLDRDKSVADFQSALDPGDLAVDQWVETCLHVARDRPRRATALANFSKAARLIGRFLQA